MTNLVEKVTRGGEIPLLSPVVTDAKLAEADRIIAGVRRGENAAVSAFRTHMGAQFGEAITTTGDDFVWAFAQLTALAVRDEYEAADQTWSQVIPTESFSSFEAPKQYIIDAGIEGFGRPETEPSKPGDIPPIVPEGSAYPSFQFRGEVAQSGSLLKAGARYDLTFEKIISDVAGIVPKIPTLITNSLLDRREYDAWNGLTTFIRANDTVTGLVAGESLDGTSTVINAPISQSALAVALMQAQNRKIRGRKVRVSSYTLLVPTGQALVANYLLNVQNLTGVDVSDGANTTRNFTLAGFNPLSGITSVVETDYLTDTEWALVPALGAISGPNPFYVYGTLVGHEAPELRVQNLTGNYLGGGVVPPFEGSFDTDSASFRGRIIGGGLGWNAEYAVYSDGTGE